MLDLSGLKKEHFKVKTEDGDVFELNPPKLKVMRRAAALSKTEAENAVDDLIGVTAALLSSNKAGKKVTEKYVEEHFDFDDINLLMREYFGWISRMRSDPN